MICEKVEVEKTVLAFKGWSSSLSGKIQKEEIELGGFCKLSIEFEID